MTINGSRGLNRSIKDRFDLTLECIRRFYINKESPLTETFQRYASFFNLFHDFGGYVDFFLLQDLVDDGYSVKFFLPFESFNQPPLLEPFFACQSLLPAFHQLAKQSDAHLGS